MVSMHFIFIFKFLLALFFGHIVKNDMFGDEHLRTIALHEIWYKCILWSQCTLFLFLRSSFLYFLVILPKMLCLVMSISDRTIDLHEIWYTCILWSQCTQFLFVSSSLLYILVILPEMGDMNIHVYSQVLIYCIIAKMQFYCFWLHLPGYLIN